jgi:hypothetical protein
MANKKVSQLTSKPSVLTTDLFPIADPSTGQLFKTTISDLGTAIGSGVSSVNTLVGAVVLDTDDIQELASPTNKWYTDTRSRAALSASSPLVYNSGTGAFSIPAATTSVNGYLTSTDWTTFNAKQAALSGTGFVKISGTTISYDNSTYLTTSSAASTYLALAGGTLTGAVTGTRLSLSQNSAEITLSISNAGTGRAFSVLGTSYFSTDIQLGYATNAILKTTSLGLITSAIAGTDYQAPLSGTGFVKISGSTISYDNSTYALDSVVVKLTGAQTIAGTKTFSDGTYHEYGLLLKHGTATNAGGYTGISGTSTGIRIGVGTPNYSNLVFSTSAIYTFTFPSATGTLALTSDLSSYLPLSGGTLTGALNGTSALFSGAVRANNPSEGATGEGLIAGQSFKIDGTGTSQRAVMYMVSNVLSDTYASGLTAQFGNFAGDKGFGFNLNTSGGYELYVKNTTWNKALTISNTNAVTLTGALSGTSATFTGDLTSNGELRVSNANGLTFLQLVNSSSGGRNFTLISSGASNPHGIAAGNFYLRNSTTSTNPLIIDGATGAATFSSSVSGTSFSNAGLQSGEVFNGTKSNAGYFVGYLQNTSATGLGLYIQNGSDTLDALRIGNAAGNANTIQLYGSGKALFAGNVGIGTTAPKLNGNAGTFVTIDGGSSSSAWLELATSSTTDGLGGAITFNNNNIAGADKRNAQISGIRDGANNSGALNFLTWNAGSASERMRITSGGYTKMTTDGTYWNASGYHEMRQTVTNNLITLFTNSSASPYGINLYFTAASPNNTTNYFLTGGDNTNDKFFIYSNGSMVNRTGTYGTISDVKYKENIVDATSKLEDISKLKVRNFNFKGDSTKQLGFIAQEFEEVFPNMIDISKESGESGETYKAIKTSVLVPMLVKAIQELKAELDTLKNK